MASAQPKPDFVRVCARHDSNMRPLPPQGSALSPELRARSDASVPVIGLDDVRAAAERLRGVAHRTPVVTSRTLDGLSGASVFLKAENLQRGGAFKFRGAYNKISSVSGDVAAYSSGNHAQAVALAASLLRRRAVILMPEDAPP